MKSLQFLEMTIVSHVEKTGRIVKFDPKTTIIQGENDTGKSCLIKSIMHALGAEPKGFHKRFKAADPIVLLSLEWQGKKYSFLRKGKFIAIFNDIDMPIIASSRITTDIAPFFARLFGLGLKIADRENDYVSPPPSFFLLPFYVDQDGGWTKVWDSFEKLSQFANWQRDVLEYHLGLFSNDFHQARAEAQEVLQTLDVSRARQGRFVEFQDEIFGDELPKVSLDIEFFRQAVEELVKESNVLAHEQRAYASELIALETRLDLLSAQSKVVRAGMNELAADSGLLDHLDDDVECPTCGQHYENNFMVRFDLAQDEARCADMLVRIQGEIAVQEKKISKIKDELKEADDRSQKVSKILERKLGEITLGEIISAEGRREWTQRFTKRREQVDIEIAESGRELQKLNEKKERLKPTKDHKEEVRSQYEINMRRNAEKLSLLTLDDGAFEDYQLSSIQESGSDLPRAILAYHASILGVMASDTSARAFFPVVVDSPNQQDQDKTNLTSILELLRDGDFPAQQKIIGMVGMNGVDFPNAKIIRLTDKLHLLQRDQYIEAASRIQPMIEYALSKS